MISWTYGQAQLPEHTMKAGETQEIIIELNFGKYPADIFPHDWSVVVWGENGPVTLTHKKGY